MEKKAAEKADIQRLIAPDMQVNEELEVNAAGRTPGQVDFDAIEEFLAKLAVSAPKYPPILRTNIRYTACYK